MTKGAENDKLLSMSTLSVSVWSGEDGATFLTAHLPGGLPILCDEGVYYPSVVAGFVTMLCFPCRL